MNPNLEPQLQTAEISLTRIVDAPRALVWRIWTDPAHASQWYGPHGFTTPVYEADLRPGGVLRVHMRSPDGTIFPSVGMFEEVVPPERLVTTGAVEINGSLAFEARTTVTFENLDGQTKITVLQQYAKISPTGSAAISGARTGWTQQFERLDAYLTRMG